MNRRHDDPPTADFTTKRTLCIEHSNQLKDLCVTIYGNGDVEKRKGSLMGIAMSNSFMLRLLVGLLIGATTILTIPVINLIYSSGRFTKQIETLSEQSKDARDDIEALQRSSIGYKKAIDGKVMDYGGGNKVQV